MHGSQRTTSGIFSVSIIWVLGIGLWWSGMAAKPLYLPDWNHLPNPNIFKIRQVSLVGNWGLPISLGWPASEPWGSAVSASAALHFSIKLLLCSLQLFSHTLPADYSFQYTDLTMYLSPRSTACSPVLLYQHSSLPASTLNSHFCTQPPFLDAKRQLKTHYPQNLIPYLYTSPKYSHVALCWCYIFFQLLGSKTLASSTISPFQSPHMRYKPAISIQNTNSYNLCSYNEISPINSFLIKLSQFTIISHKPNSLRVSHFTLSKRPCPYGLYFPLPNCC